jgi:transcriptional regulator NrdR family protein
MNAKSTTRGSVRQCPRCGGPKSEVADSRDEAGRLKRRRKCLACGHRWSTVEMPIAAYEAITTAKEALGAAALAVETARRIIAALEHPSIDPKADT